MIANLTTKSVKELREIAKTLEIAGRWDMNKDQLIKAIEFVQKKREEERIEAERKAQQKKEEVETSRRKGRTRVIEVYKDGQLVTRIEGLIETFKWAAENKVCNQGWVKHSLKTGKETVAGRKFKEGGYLFKYAE
jgi:hypothetical protein